MTFRDRDPSVPRGGAVLGKGVEKILEIRLNEDEKAALAKTLDELKKTVAEAKV